MTKNEERARHLRCGEVKKREICGKETYYKRTYLKYHNPRTCSISHAAVLKHREGWTPRNNKRPPSKYRQKTTYRRKGLTYYGEKCMLCGFDEDVRLLDVDHKNGDRSDDRIENLQVLCVMCHAKYTRKILSRS